MSRQQSKEPLRTRWDDETTAFTLDALLRGRPTSAYGTYQGRIDLRGIVIEKSERIRINEKLARIAKLNEFESKTISDVDLSYSVLNDLRVIESTFENCIFDNVKLPDFRAYSARFNGCSFKSASLRDATMGAKETGSKTGSVYQACDFSSADLRDISTEHGRFSECIFVGSQWLGTQTLSAVFENCDFRDAKITRVVFDGRKFDNNGLVGLSENKMKCCDFSTAEITDTSFLAIDFRNLIPPENERYPLIDDFPARVKVALDRLKANGSEEALGLAFIFEGEFRASTVMPPGSVGTLDFGVLSDTEARLLAAVFEVSR